jgi:hypothetical protein
MQAEVERILGNLHVLGALSHNDKLMTNEDAFDIYIPTTWRGVVRSWYGERRGQNVARIRSTVRGAIEFSQRTLTDIRAYNRRSDTEDVDVNTLRRETMELQFRRMIDGLRRARDGLTNLIQTYRDDAALSSQIRLINEEIGDFLSVMNRHVAAQSSPSSTARRVSPPATSSPHLAPLVLDVASDDVDKTATPSTRPPTDL